LSVSCQLLSFIAAPGSWFYGGDNYCDAGGWPVLLSVITQSDGLLFTIVDGQDEQNIRGQQNGTGIATGAVLALGG
jgi:hypothetical protein